MKLKLPLLFAMFIINISTGCGKKDVGLHGRSFQAKTDKRKPNVLSDKGDVLSGSNNPKANSDANAGSTSNPPDNNPSSAPNSDPSPSSTPTTSPSGTPLPSPTGTASPNPTGTPTPTGTPSPTPPSVETCGLIPPDINGVRGSGAIQLAKQYVTEYEELAKSQGAVLNKLSISLFSCNPGNQNFVISYDGPTKVISPLNPILLPIGGSLCTGVIISADSTGFIPLFTCTNL